MEKIFNNDDILREKYMVIYCKVYDIKGYMNEHPGGEDILKDNLGRDATEDFEDIGHSASAIALLEKYKIGVLADCQISKTRQTDDSDNTMYYIMAFIVMMSGLVFAIMRIM